jgi:hypothetical protein
MAMVVVPESELSEIWGVNFPVILRKNEQKV